MQTHVKFGARQELPALFVRNEDGSESLVNFSVEAAELIVHRVARQFVVRRGNLQGCIVNQALRRHGRCPALGHHRACGAARDPGGCAVSSPAPHADPDFGAARTEAESGTVRGERATALVSSLRSLQARASSMLAAGLMIALGLGALSWYYAHAFTRQTRAHASAQASAASRAQGEMPLPALGPIEAMTAAAPAPGRAPLAPPAGAAAHRGAPPQGTPRHRRRGSGAARPRSAGELALQRRLEGVGVRARSVRPRPRR